MSEIYLRIEVKLISFSCGLIPNDSGPIGAVGIYKRDYLTF